MGGCPSDNLNAFNVIVILKLRQKEKERKRGFLFRRDVILLLGNLYLIHNTISITYTCNTNININTLLFYF